MRTFALRPGTPDYSLTARRRRFSACAGSLRQTRPHRTSVPCRSRNLGTAFRSLATTLSPPLRGQSSWPAPSLPPRKLPRVRSIPGSFAPSGFEAEPGRDPRPEPVSRVNFQCSRSLPGLHSPSGPLTKPSRSKRSTGPISGSSPRWTPDCLSLPAASSFDSAPDQC